MPADEAELIDFGVDAPAHSPRRARALSAILHPTDEGRVLLLNILSVAEITLGLLLFLVSVPQFQGELALFVLLLGLNLAAERSQIVIYGDTSMTIGFAFTLAMIILFGAPGVAIAAPLDALVRRAGKGILTNKLLMLRSMFHGVIVRTTAASVYALFAPIGPARPDLDMIPAGLAASAMSFGLSAAILTLVVSLRTGQPVSLVWENHRWLAPHYLALGIVGVGLAAAYSGLGYAGIAAFLIPALMMRLSMKQVVDKTTENVEKLREQNAALERANVEIRLVSDELRVTYDATLEAMVNALEARDQETKGHSVRVAHYMLNIAEALGAMPGTQDWLDMQHGALLHDIGKIGVRDNILLKPGKLTPEEWELMRMHPEIGHNILKEVGFLHGAAEIVLAHHERWDGHGYPKGLRAEEIPLGSRIFSVVDTFDSMTSDRPYRRALGAEESLKEILSCSGTQFDPLVVEAFLDIYDAWVIEREKMHGLTVLRRAA